MTAATEYRYSDANPTWGNQYLWPVIESVIARREFLEKRAFDLGCGNGATANFLSRFGFEVRGVDPSKSGIAMARQSFPNLRFEEGSAYDELAAAYGQYPLVISLEVIEHCFDPRKFAKTFFDLVEPNGTGIVSTPYHGYWKNLALALLGKWEAHMDPLWEGGHVKLFSIKTLGALLRETGFRDVSFMRVGRIPPLAKSMVAIVRK